MLCLRYTWISSWTCYSRSRWYTFSMWDFWRDLAQAAHFSCRFICKGNMACRWNKLRRKARIILKIIFGITTFVQQMRWSNLSIRIRRTYGYCTIWKWSEHGCIHTTRRTYRSIPLWAMSFSERFYKNEYIGYNILDASPSVNGDLKNWFITIS